MWRLKINSVHKLMSPGEKRVLPLPAELSTSPHQAPAPSPPPSTTSSTSQPTLPPALTIVYRLFLDVEDQSLGPSCVLKAKPKHLNRSWETDLINVGGGRAFVAVKKTESVWLEMGDFFEEICGVMIEVHPREIEIDVVSLNGSYSVDAFSVKAVKRRGSFSKC